MLDPNLVFLGAALGLIGCGRYAVATLRGQARPNRVTWFLWAAAPLIGFLAQLDSGVGLPAVLTLSAGLGPLIVLFASFASSHGTVRIGGFDLACGAVSLAALAVWVGLGAAATAVGVAVLADATAALPTLRKAWRDPDSENALFYVLAGVNAALTLLTIDTWTMQTRGFAVYMFALSLGLTTVLCVRRARLGGRPAGVSIHR